MQVADSKHKSPLFSGNSSSSSSLFLLSNSINAANLSPTRRPGTKWTLFPSSMVENNIHGCYITWMRARKRLPVGTTGVNKPLLYTSLLALFKIFSQQHAKSITFRCVMFDWTQKREQQRRTSETFQWFIDWVPEVKLVAAAASLD